MQGWCLKPSRIGDLIPSGSPGSVSGLVFLLNHTALYIRDFHSDLSELNVYSIMLNQSHFKCQDESAK